MPSLERPALDARLVEQSKDAALTRVNAYIDQYEAKLRDGCKGGPTISAAEETLVVKAQLEKWYAEREAILHPHAQAPAPTEAVTGLGKMVQALQQQVEDLKAKLSTKEPTDGAVSRPQTAPKS